MHRCRSSVNIGGGEFSPENTVYEELTKCPNFTWCARIIIRIIKMPYNVFARKLQNSWILHDNCPINIFFPNLGGHVPPLSPVPTLMQKCTDKCNKQQHLKNITAPVSTLNIYSRLNCWRHKSPMSAINACGWLTFKNYSYRCKYLMSANDLLK